MTPELPESNEHSQSFHMVNTVLDPHDLIWIVEAEKEFNRSREWFLKQVKLGKLHKTKIVGDRRV